MRRLLPWVFNLAAAAAAVPLVVVWVLWARGPRDHDVLLSWPGAWEVFAYGDWVVLDDVPEVQPSHVVLGYHLQTLGMFSALAALACFAMSGVCRGVPRRRRPGHCASCGYDLRATPEAGGALLGRCPECGAESAVPERRKAT